MDFLFSITGNMIVILRILNKIKIERSKEEFNEHSF